ncbi:MAG TPA: hypothetical protein VHW92_03840 [Mycobacteriales bacterium]|jgi:hypothetical protein|nr:hypothetical protein [Mycobacteriales bacterium]
MTEPTEPTERAERAEPESSSDERPVGWGDEREDPSYDEDAGDADDQRLIAERPPHHDRPD